MSHMMYAQDDIAVRPFVRKDMTPEYYSWFYDPYVTKYNSHGLFPYTKKQMNDFLERLSSPNNIIWAIIILPYPDNDVYIGIKGLHIGNISFQNINWVNRSAEFAVVIGNKDYWGKGYCTKAARFLLHHGFNKLNLHRIWTGTAATNEGMKRVAWKLGMTQEATFRDGVYLEGKYVDVNVYGILKDEWNG